MTEDLALCAVQLALGEGDFASEEAFSGHLERLAAQAARACGDARHRLFVFPENTGHFLSLIWAPQAARQQATLEAAMAQFILRRPLAIARQMWSSKVASLRRALLLTLTPRADAMMRRLFSAIARQHRAFVVAGSHLSPVARSVSNTSYSFDPEGSLRATTRKVNLVAGMEDDLPGALNLARGCADSLPVVDAPWGRLTTLICYDGFCRPHSKFEPFEFMGQRADACKVDVIANPAANPWPWNQRWVYADASSDMLRREQWRLEGLPATLARLKHVRYGVTAHLCGDICELSFSGRSEILANEAESTVILARADSDRGDAVAVARVPVPRSPAASHQ